MIITGMAIKSPMQQQLWTGLKKRAQPGTDAEQSWEGEAKLSLHAPPGWNSHSEQGFQQIGGSTSAPFPAAPAELRAGFLRS